MFLNDRLEKNLGGEMMNLHNKIFGILLSECNSSKTQIGELITREQESGRDGRMEEKRD